MTPDQKKLAAKVQGILVAKGPDGEYLYSKQEVRDFIVACVFQLGLPVTKELEGAMVGFCADLQLSQDATTEDIADHVVAYFDENPLNPRILAEFAELGRGALFSDRVATTNAAEKVRQLVSSGKVDALRAPTEKAAAQPVVKARRGLSR